ncbi:MAG: carboxypeptidase-like regulatory domain-containing protein [Acidobacteriota bacterium]
MTRSTFAILVCVVLSSPLWAQPPAAPNTAAKLTGSIRGLVVSTTGAPISKATVQLQPVNAGTATVANQAGQINRYIEVSASDGSFEFKGLPFGRYGLTAQKPGFAVGLAAQQVNQITLTAAESHQEVRYPMEPLGVITGRVIDSDGDPAANVQVQVMRYNYQQGRTRLQMQNIVVSDDHGEFRIANLQPGRYFVRAGTAGAQNVGGNVNETRGASARDTSLSTYYPSSPDPSHATRIEVQSGSEVAGINIRLARGQNFSLKGKVLDDAGLPLNSQLTLTDRNTEMMASLNLTTTSSRPPDGAFQFSSVPAGDYILTVRGTPVVQATNVAGVVTAPARAQPLQFGRFEISVRSNTSDLVLRVAPGATITGHLTLEGGGKIGAGTLAPVVVQSLPNGVAQPQPAAIFNLADVDGTGGTIAVPVQADGSFTITNVTPSRYTISNTNQIAQQSYVKSIRLGDQDVTSQFLDFHSNISGQLEITLGAKPGKLTAEVRDPKGELVPNARIAIWAKQPHLADQTGTVRVLRSRPGTFKNVSVAPGEYYIAAWEDSEQQLLQNPDFLAQFSKLAASFKLEEGGSVTVDPTWISKEVSDKVVDRFPDQ